MDIFILFCEHRNGNIEVDSVYKHKEDAEVVRDERYTCTIADTFTIQKHNVIRTMTI